MIAAAVFGALIGVFLGLLGAGGSILAVPALVYGAGQPLTVAIPTSLLVVAASSIAALLPRMRANLVRWPVSVVFAGAGIPAAFAGSALGRTLSDRVVLLGFAALMAVVAVLMLRGGAAPTGACAAPHGRVDRRRCLPGALLTGAAVGFLTGVFGVGGGFVIVPALTMLLGLAPPQAVATSLVIIAINAVAGFAAHAKAVADLHSGIVLAFAGPAVAASLIAGRFAARLPADTIRRWFAYLILLVAAGVAVAASLTHAGLGHG